MGRAGGEREEKCIPFSLGGWQSDRAEREREGGGGGGRGQRYGYGQRFDVLV